MVFKVVCESQTPILASSHIQPYNQTMSGQTEKTQQKTRQNFKTGVELFWVIFPSPVTSDSFCPARILPRCPGSFRRQNVSPPTARSPPPHPKNPVFHFQGFPLGQAAPVGLPSSIGRSPNFKNKRRNRIRKPGINNYTIIIGDYHGTICNGCGDKGKVQ